MLFTIVSLYDVFNDNEFKSDFKKLDMPSTNPYDYINDGYYIDNLKYFGGDNIVSFKCDIYGNFTGHNNGTANK